MRTGQTTILPSGTGLPARRRAMASLYVCGCVEGGGGIIFSVVCEGGDGVVTM